MEIVSRSLEETADFASKILTNLAEKGRQNKLATVVGLVGDLGAGKTTFTQAVSRQLGIRAPIQSPTFVIMKSYSIPSKKVRSCQWPWRQLVHIDCYRLDKADDLLHLGWNELIANPENLILVEWPERMGDLLSAPALKINFEVTGESERKIWMLP
ncbi:MAG: tRNA (adenosine(37)-N6)-threonylcarbamoyltransferase complex ATPase subunit type 1 TsaE [Candidatus Vogelbacteria bacterium]|nr:tRNA (adenosine(37)-N6)-threonylcarbamoyltransferase complex ATPase subunit type 1 TsaE [Candidatus Vogelbacteria bacterium]